MTDPGNPEPPPPPAASPPSAPDETPRVPDHDMIRLIGSGSSGQVWLARNALGTYRAVKVVYEKTFRHRRPFEREFNGVLKFEPLSRLHDGLVDILQVGRNTEGGYFYCVMELADDVFTAQAINPDEYEPRTLAQDAARRQRLPIEQCVRLGASVASALKFLHEHGLVHRDIKPSNIVYVNGASKLADIGLVTEVSDARSYVGTEGFIPPEGPGTPQADIYSLGKVLYEISTGKDRHDYPELPEDLDHTARDRDLIQLNRLIVKACRSDPRARFRTAEDLMTALATFQFSAVDPRTEELRQRLTITAAIVGIVVGLGVVIGLVCRLIWLLRNAG